MTGAEALAQGLFRGSVQLLVEHLGWWNLAWALPALAFAIHELKARRAHGPRGTDATS